MDLADFIAAQHRAFGATQSWSSSKRGAGGERLVADLLEFQVNAKPGGSVLFVGLDLGKPGHEYPLPESPDGRRLRGIGGDVDVALFLRKYQLESGRYDLSRRGLVQDHLVLIDSKQYANDHERRQHFERAGRVLRWLREVLADPLLLGSGATSSSLRLSYHFAHTGEWRPRSWLRRVDADSITQEDPDFEWWNDARDLVLESPAEVLLGQLSILLAFAHPDYRAWVPEALWNLLAPEDRHPYATVDE